MDAEQERRLAKLDALRGEGVEPYPYRFDRSDTLGELRRRVRPTSSRGPRPTSASASPVGSC